MNIIHERRADRTEAPQPNNGIAFAHIHRPFRKQHDTGEFQLHCAGDAVRWPFKITGLVKFLGVLLILTAFIASVQAAGSVNLAWNKSTNSTVTGYNVYYGGACGAYSNKICVGNATNAIVSSLVEGATYYFAATTYTSLGLESSFSSEISYTVPVTTAVASIWPVTAVPAVVDGGADSAVELGVKFSSDVAGSITGVRFYKASANTGTHVGNLWTSTGTLLATATFTGETASGWQQVTFATPVSITANTVYVASYHANTGHYSFDNNCFSANGVDNPPLHALATGVSGGNGVYAYGSSSAFPNQVSSTARNYWVDVVWQAGLPIPGMQLRITPTRQFILTVNGPVGQTYNIQATQDFKTWTVIGTGTVGTNGSLNFTDTNAASFSSRFYRTQ
jgi:hypothetical protein